MRGLAGSGPRAVLFACLALAPAVSAHERPSKPARIDLSHARVSLLGDGRVVIAMAAAGDLPGLLTLRLERATDPEIIGGGEWALVVTRVVDDGDGHGHHEHGGRDDERDERDRRGGEGASPHGESEPHEELIRIVDEGTLAGRVIGGRLRLTRHGAVSTLEGVELEVDSGSLALEELGGEGSLEARGLQSPSASGELRLTLRSRP